MAKSPDRRTAEIAAIERLMADHNLTMKDLSILGGKNGTYVQQFIQYAKPYRLSPAFREAIAEKLQLDDRTLTPTIAGDVASAPGIRQLPNRQDMPKDVPVLGTGAGSLEGAVNIDGPIDHIRRPLALSGARNVYAIFINGDSMEPRYFAGDPVFVSPDRPIGVGDHVVVQCRSDDGELHGFVKRIAGRSGSGWRFTQYNPAGEWKPPAPVESVHRIFTNADLYLV